MKFITLFLVFNIILNITGLGKNKFKANSAKTNVKPTINKVFFKDLFFVIFKNKYILNPHHNWGLKSKNVEIKVSNKDILITYKSNLLNNFLSIPLLKYL